jgi:hypothetical protein
MGKALSLLPYNRRTGPSLDSVLRDLTGAPV